jgi:hypothetical protein
MHLKLLSNHSHLRRRRHDDDNHHHHHEVLSLLALSLLRHELLFFLALRDHVFQADDNIVV